MKLAAVVLLLVVLYAAALELVPWPLYLPSFHSPVYVSPLASVSVPWPCGLPSLFLSPVYSMWLRLVEVGNGQRALIEAADISHHFCEL